MILPRPRRIASRAGTPARRGRLRVGCTEAPARCLTHPGTAVGSGHKGRAMAKQERAAKPKRHTAKLEHIAYHEAGHTVAAVVLGRRFFFVTIEPTDDYTACVWIAGRPVDRLRPGSSPGCKDTNRYRGGGRDVIDHEVMLFSAGIAARLIREGHTKPDLNHLASCDWTADGEEPDLRATMEIADTMWHSEAVGTAWRFWLFFRAWDILAEPKHWAAVKALASALLERKTISSRTARKIIREAISAVSVT